MLDALIEPAFFGRLPERTMLAERLARSLAQAEAYEDVLDRARIFGQEQAFLIGVRVLAGTIGARARPARPLPTSPKCVVSALLDEVRTRVRARRTARCAGGQVAVLAMGKLGGREMTAASDLDLIFLYDFDETGRALPTARGRCPARSITRA